MDLSSVDGFTLSVLIAEFLPSLHLVQAAAAASWILNSQHLTYRLCQFASVPCLVILMSFCVTLGPLLNAL
jgi:hypothetical protein